MTEEQEKGQPEQAQQDPPESSGLQTPQPDQRMPTEAERSEQPKTDDQRQAEARAAEAQQPDNPDEPQDAPEGYEPQVELQPGQSGGIVERHGERPSDVEEAESDQLEADAEQNDDEAVDAPDTDAAE